MDFRPSAISIAVACAAYSFGYLFAHFIDSKVEKVELPATVMVINASTRESVVCEFDKPLKYVTTMYHWYDTYEDLNVDYAILAEPDDPTETVWGWSNCVWQEEDNAAWCDVYAVVPEYVDADMNMDTVGHEAMHGACGQYHD